MYLATFLTILPILVTASPIPLTRDNHVAKPDKNELKVVVCKTLYPANIFFPNKVVDFKIKLTGLSRLNDMSTSAVLTVFL
jgi:hypothetical protein